MSGSAPTNNQAVDFEKQQAAEADAKEAARQQRLQQGTDVINKLFDPQPVMQDTAQNYDWSKFNPTTARAVGPNAFGVTSSDPSLPAGYSVVNAPTKTTAAPSRYATAGGAPSVNLAGASPSGSYTDRYGHTNAPQSYAPASTSAASAPTYAVQGPDGKIYYKGDPLSYTTQTPTGRTSGGFGDDFFNAYKQKYLDYYLPDEARQYDVAKRDLSYNLARAGTLNSSTAADKAGDLAYNDANAQATIKSNANQATGQLQQSIQDQKQSLINQLYSTEDPTLTANLAQSAANASKLVSPNLTPAAAFFTPALTAAGAAASSYFSPYSTYPGVGGTTGGANVVPANQSSGKVTGGSY
jgi:hypothetical protein